MQTQTNRIEVSYTDIAKLFGQTTAVTIKPPTNTSALIDSYVKYGSNRLSNDEVFIDKVSQEAAKQILVSNATTEYYKSQVNLDETIRQFLDSQYSPKTRQTYAAVLTKLTGYLEQHHIPLLDLTHKQASDFIHDLYDKYSPRYLRLIVHEHRLPHLRRRTPPVKAVKFPLQRREKRLRARVVPALALAAHALADVGAARPQRPAEGMRAVLRAPVRMVCRLWRL